MPPSDDADKKASTLKKKAAPKTTALTRARTALTSVLKEDHVVPLTADTLRASMPHIPTGSLNVDYLIGGRPNQYGVAPCPGLPRGRIVNLYGNSGAGKTTLALTVAAAVCAAGGTVAYIDWENEVEPRYAQRIGVPVTDESRFLLLQPNTLEEGMKIMVQMAIEGVDLIVVDSVGAGVPEDLYTRDVKEEGNQSQMGTVARKWSQFLPKYKAIIRQSGTCLLGISQLRKTMGGMGHGPDSAPQGGEAWKFYSAIRMMLRVFQKEKGKTFNQLTNKHEEAVTGTIVLAKLDKCKVSDSVHHEQKFYLESGLGIDNARSVVELAIAFKVISKVSGSWLQWSTAPKGEVKLNGMGAFMKAFKADPKNTEVLFAQVKAKMMATDGTLPSDDAPAEEEMGDELPDDLFGIIPVSGAAAAAAEKLPVVDSDDGD